MARTLVLRPESGFVQINVHTDFRHSTGFDQFFLDRLGVVMQHFVGTEYFFTVFVKPRFQWQEITRVCAGHSLFSKSSVRLGGLGRFGE